MPETIPETLAILAEAGLVCRCSRRTLPSAGTTTRAKYHAVDVLAFHLLGLRRQDDRARASASSLSPR